MLSCMHVYLRVPKFMMTKVPLSFVIIALYESLMLYVVTMNKTATATSYNNGHENLNRAGKGFINQAALV